MREMGVPGVFFYTGNFFENTVLRGHVRKREDGELEFRQPVILEDTKCITSACPSLPQNSLFFRPSRRPVLRVVLGVCLGSFWLMVVAMLYVEKDLSQCVKVILDKWETKREKLNHKYFYVANCRLTPREFKTAIEKGLSPETPTIPFSFPLILVPPHFVFVKNYVDFIVTGRKCTYTVLPTTGVPDRDIMFKLYNGIGMYGSKEIPDEGLLELGVRFHSVEDFIRERLMPYLQID